MRRLLRFRPNSDCAPAHTPPVAPLAPCCAPYPRRSLPCPSARIHSPPHRAQVESRYEKGVWFVEGQQWSLPPHYRLLSKLGAGSFSQARAGLTQAQGRQQTGTRVVIT